MVNSTNLDSQTTSINIRETDWTIKNGHSKILSQLNDTSLWAIINIQRGRYPKVHVIIGNFLKYIILLKTEIDDIVKLN
jgi:hypothetical protein